MVWAVSLSTTDLSTRSLTADHNSLAFGVYLRLVIRDGPLTQTVLYLLDLAEQEASPEIALAAIKYADLSGAIHKDYVFDAERMVQTTGDTGPYL